MLHTWLDTGSSCPFDQFSVSPERNITDQKRRPTDFSPGSPGCDHTGSPVLTLLLELRSVNGLVCASDSYAEN